MNYAIILAGGTGVRMKTSGLPKQFLNVYGKPIIIYTLEVFENNPDIDEIIIPCNEHWLGKMKSLVKAYAISKAKIIIKGGEDRNGSIINGIEAIRSKLKDDDVITIHDGVRPLVQSEIISENIAVAKEKGNAMTVKKNIETVVVTKEKTADFENFKDRRFTYTLTSPQTFKLKSLRAAIECMKNAEDGDSEIPLLDLSIALSKLSEKINLVVEEGLNIKITTPEDFYYLKSYLELLENKSILGA